MDRSTASFSMSLIVRFLMFAQDLVPLNGAQVLPASETVRVTGSAKRCSSTSSLPVADGLVQIRAQPLAGSKSGGEVLHAVDHARRFRNAPHRRIAP